jgi:molybdopterin-containing oxidoreductase family iron-sulfur binding subunit
MDESRRNFLKIAGVATLGAAWSIPVVRAIAQAFKTEPAPQALNAKSWAMVVDVEKCKRKDVARACQNACHRIHNVPEIDNPEEVVKWIWTESYARTFPTQNHKFAQKDKSVLVLCNHCERPPCVRVCPAQATYRSPEGIVMMDMHRCVGCRYCIVACPYGSRSFNWRDPRPFIQAGITPDYPTRSKGVVEKCNFCAERLAKGLKPACVEAANQVAGPGAMAFGDSSDEHSEVGRLLRSKYTIRRKPSLGTEPQVYYVV